MHDLLQKEVREVFPECGHLSPSGDRVARWKILARVLLTGLKKARATEKATEPLEFPSGYPLDVCRGQCSSPRLFQAAPPHSVFLAPSSRGPPSVRGK